MHVFRQLNREFFRRFKHPHPHPARSARRASHQAAAPPRAGSVRGCAAFRGLMTVSSWRQ
jgi:hypothetical protein